MASRDALAIEPNSEPGRACGHGERQTHPLGARSREHVRLPHRRAAGCNDAGNKLSVPGAAGAKTRPYFLQVRRPHLEQRASLSGGILLAAHIKFDPALRLPEGWKFASALDAKSQNGNLVQFKDTPLNTLIDSPLYAGVNFKRVDLSTGPDNPVYLDVFADKPADLEITPEELQYHKNLVIEAQKLFNSHHYDHYDFLFSVSDTVSGKGLEHHQSSEDGARANYFTDWACGSWRSRSAAPRIHPFVERQVSPAG